MSEAVFFPFAFEAPIEKFGVGKKRVIWYHVVIAPADICANLPLANYPRLRIEGEIADIPIANALMPTGDGRHYIIIAPTILKASGARVGDLVDVRFRIADQDHVDTPAELARAIARQRRFEDAWDALTPGKKRMLAQHVQSAKTPTTRAKRTREAIEALMDHRADLRAWRKAAKR
ncbi:MAG: YdeI/OmpD-associated family protein [Pseudomonadota bacterium]